MLMDYSARAQTQLDQVLSPALAEVLVVFEVDLPVDLLLVVDLLVDPVPQPATSAVDQTTLLEIARLRL